FPPMRESAYRSFHPMEESDWQQTVAMAKNDREREVLWLLLGIQADPSVAIEKIYAANPRSTALPLLLVRQIRETERHWNVWQDDTKRDPASLSKSVASIRKIADDPKADKRYLWQLGAGYLLAVAGDTKL